MAICKHKDCSVVLPNGNKTGMCLPHYHADYRARNRTKAKEYAQQWRDDNPDYCREYHNANKEKRNGQSRAYRDANLDWYRKWAEDNRDLVCSYSKVWRKNNPDKVSEQEANRRALQKSLHVERVTRVNVHSSFNGQCHLCLKPVSLRGMHMDHVIPMNWLGPHCYANIAPACASCNTSKRDNVDVLSSSSEVIARAKEAYMDFHGISWDEIYKLI